MSTCNDMKVITTKTDNNGEWKSKYSGQPARPLILLIISSDAYFPQNQYVVSGLRKDSDQSANLQRLI